MAGAVVEHPDCDSDTKLAATTNRKVCLAGIEKLGSWVDSNVLQMSGLDNEDLRRSDVLDWAYEIGE